jgi:[ribosomal protein S5]-alanine N-acetyltransferase
MVKNFTPFPVLQTARLTLRQLRISDDEKIFALRSNDYVNKYLGRSPGKSIEDSKNFIHTINQNIQLNDSIYWAIALKSTDELIGTICLFNFSDDNSKAEIGYELLPEFWGKGIMKEASEKVIEFGIHHISLTSIEAYTHIENESSTRLLEKLNFKKDCAADKNFMTFKLTHNS